MAVDANTGNAIAGALGGWRWNAAAGAPQFDGSFDLERLPLGNCTIYAEPLNGLVTPSDFSSALGDLCSSSGASVCITPDVNANFNPRILPASP